jgi:hypothetical protein
MLFALFPGRESAEAENLEARIRAHVELGADIPAPLYAEACLRVAKTWTYPSTPNPGDIRKAAHKAAVELLQWERATAQRQRQMDLERGAMSASDARAELDRIASEPNQMSAWEAIGTELYVSALQARIARDTRKRIGARHLKAIDGGDSA